MGSVRPIREERRPAEPLHAHAYDQLQYIREAMEGAGSFTAVPGWGGVAIGCVALAASAAAAGRDRREWLWIWFATLVTSIVIAVWGARSKARRIGVELLSGPGRKFARSFAPAMAAGGLLTLALSRAGFDALLPGVWLLLYGVAVVNAGVYSVRAVPALGLSVMAMGGAALLSPASWGDAYMAAGFGALNIGFGYWIARNYGG